MAQIDKSKEELIEEITLLNKRIGEFESERKQQQQQQMLLHRIINLLPIRVFWKDKNLKYLGCNEIFAKDAGKNKPEDLIGKDDSQLGWKDQANIYRDDDQKVIESGKGKLQFEEPQTTPSGDDIWLITSKVPLTDTEGNIIGILGTYADITERKRMEMASIHLKAIVESAEDGIVSKDLNSIITSWNHGAEKMFGYTPGEIVGTSIMRLIPSDRLNEENYILDKIKRGEVVGYFETVRQTKDGRPIDVSITASPIKDPSGKIIGVSKIIRDITKNKRAEEESQKRLQELEVFYKASVGREERILELKKEIEQLKKEPGK